MKNEIINIRRAQLKKWIEENYNEPFKQAQFIRDLEKKNPDVTINQGEIASLMKNKTFGEKKARSLEALIGLPNGWLDNLSNHPLDDYKIVYDMASEENKKMILSLLQAVKIMQGNTNNERGFKAG